MEPIKIPQNVGIEDKIVGPLTLRQLIILAVGFGVSYTLFAILNRIYELNILEFIVIGLPILVAAAFAMIRINDIPLIRFIFLFLEFAIKPKKRVWDHRSIVATLLPDLNGAKTSPEPTPEETEKAAKAANLSELSKVLDSGGFDHVRPVEHADLDISKDEDLVTEAYFGHKAGTGENMYWRTKESHKKRLDLFAKLPITNVKRGSKEADIMKQEVMEAKREVEQMQQEQASAVTAVETAPKPKRKRRPRNRKPAQPARLQSLASDVPHPEKQVNPIQAPSATRPEPPKPAPENPHPAPAIPESLKKGGEFKLEELQHGEIEIDLD